MTSPIVDIRDTSGNLISSLSYIQSAPDGYALPVDSGETSNPVYFRIYNNYALASGIANAYDVRVTTYDGVGPASRTCAVTPVSQSWVQVQMYGYGENSVDTPDRFTYFLGNLTAIGGNNPCGGNYYSPEAGSNGVASPATIRAYSTNAGMGFIEIMSNGQVPTSGVTNTAYLFAVSVSFEWTT